MNIKNEQKEYLESYSCTRISEDDIPLLQAISIAVPDDESDPYFYSLSSSQKLLNTITSSALSQDKENKTAFYVIKNKSQQIVLVFSIRNGSIYDNSERQADRDIFNRYRILCIALQAREKVDNGIEVEKNLLTLKNLHAEAFSYDKLKTLFDDFCKKHQTLLSTKIQDLEKETAIYYAGEVHPALELHIFWKNPNYSNTWKSETQSLDFPKDKRMGEILFWYFVISKVKEAVKYVGCKYFYLFAADSTEDEELIAYYNNLGFITDTRMSTLKPRFDYACKFMYQEIERIFKTQAEFFNNFNLDKKEILA